MKTTRKTWLLLLCLSACGGDEEPTGMDWGAAFEGCGEEAFNDGAYSVNRWQSGATPTEDVSARSKRWRGDAGRSAPAYPAAGPGFPGRGAQLSPAGRQIAQRFEPSLEDWPHERFAQAAEAALTDSVRALVGEGLVDLDVDFAEWRGDEGTTRAILRLGTREGTTRTQRDAVWRCSWSGTADAPQLNKVEVLEATETSSSAPVFEDVTEAALGALPFWEQELLLGNDAYHQRTDAKVAFFFAGLLGMAVGDVDGDGWEDVYLSQLGGQPNRLLVRGEDGGFRDATAAAEVGFLDTTRGALLVDLDGDGHLDLAVGKGAEVALCWNDGKGRFGTRKPLDGPGKSPVYSISAGDGDGDGDLDLFCCRYPHAGLSGGVPSPYHEATNGARNLYWRNEGGRNFVECAEEVGLGDVNRFTYMAVFEDYDSDGDQDLYVVNDYGTNQLYESEGGRFTDVAALKGALNPAAGMGLSVTDCDLDGHLDLYVSNMHTPVGARIAAMKGFRSGATLDAYQMHAEGNALLFGEGGGEFTDRGADSGVAVGGWSWGAVFGDWNNDGWPDLYVPNGFVSGDRADELASLYWRELVRSSPEKGEASAAYRDAWQALGHMSQWDGYSWAGNERNYAYLNIGGGEFADTSYVSGTDFLDDGRVATALDFDRDGHLDMLLRNRTGPRLRLLRGTGAAGGSSLSLDLSHPAPNTGGVGAKVTVTLSDGRTLTRTKYAGEGLLGQSSHRLHFGLGAATPSLVQVRWPDGEVERHEGLKPGRWAIARGGAPEEQPMSAKAPLAGRGEASLPIGRGRASRVVLADKLPAKAWSFPKEGGGKVSLEEILSQPGRRGVLVVVWDPESEPDTSYLKALKDEADEIQGGGIVVIPMRRGDSKWNTGPLLMDLGMDPYAARMTQAEERLVQLFLVEVIGLHEEVPMPVSLLFDTSGGLCSLYFGPEVAPLVAADARKLRYANPAVPDTTALSGGLWLARPKRDRAALGRAFGMLGARDLQRGLGR